MRFTPHIYATGPCIRCARVCMGRWTLSPITGEPTPWAYAEDVIAVAGFIGD